MALLDNLFNLVSSASAQQTTFEDEIQELINALLASPRLLAIKTVLDALVNSGSPFNSKVIRKIIDCGDFDFSLKILEDFIHLKNPCFKLCLDECQKKKLLTLLLVLVLFALYQVAFPLPTPFVPPLAPVDPDDIPVGSKNTHTKFGNSQDELEALRNEIKQLQMTQQTLVEAISEHSTVINAHGHALSKKTLGELTEDDLKDSIKEDGQPINRLVADTLLAHLHIYSTQEGGLVVSASDLKQACQKADIDCSHCKVNDDHSVDLANCPPVVASLLYTYQEQFHQKQAGVHNDVDLEEYEVSLSKPKKKSKFPLFKKSS